MIDHAFCSIEKGFGGGLEGVKKNRTERRSLKQAGDLDSDGG